MNVITAFRAALLMCACVCAQACVCASMSVSVLAVACGLQSFPLWELTIYTVTEMHKCL